MSQSRKRLPEHKPFGLELLHCGSKQPLARLTLWGLSCCSIGRTLISKGSLEHIYSP